MRLEIRSPIDRETHPTRPPIRTACTLLLLLIAIVQGISPDANNLASSRIFDVLMPLADCDHPPDTWDGDSYGLTCSGMPGEVGSMQNPEFLPITFDSTIPLSSCERPISRGLRPLPIDCLYHLTC